MGDLFAAASDSRVIQSLRTGSSACPVFCVGRDRALLQARQRGMVQAGLPVQSLLPEQAEPFMRDVRPRLWIFCGSVESATLILLAGSIRRYSPESSLVLVEYDRPAGLEGSLFHRIIGLEGCVHFSAMDRLDTTA